jgi:hypothetical protein
MYTLLQLPVIHIHQQQAAVRVACSATGPGPRAAANESARPVSWLFAPARQLRMLRTGDMARSGYGTMEMQLVEDSSPGGKACLPFTAAAVFFASNHLRIAACST